MPSTIAAFWGKATPSNESAAAIHPLLAHSLDVAAVAVLLAGQRPSRIDPRMLGFLVSLHDVGKFSRPFQAKMRAHWPVGALGLFPATDPPPGPKHDAVGLHFLSGICSGPLLDLLPAGPGRARGWKAGDRARLWRALAGHHGRPPAALDRIPAVVMCNGCHDAAGQFLDTMQTVFNPLPWERPVDEYDVARLSWHLAGLTTLADWIGSRQAWFPYVPAEAVADPTVFPARAGMNRRAPVRGDAACRVFPARAGMNRLGAAAA